MNTAEFVGTIHALHERLLSLTASKGEEYKRREDNQFANFERGALALGLTREQVLMVYLSKHLDSITTYVRDRAKGQDRDYAEPITGRIDDAILYLLLLRGMAVENIEAGAGDTTFELPLFEEIQSGGSAPPVLVEMMNVGGSTTANRDVLVEPRIVNLSNTFVISSSWLVSAAECNRRGLEVATRALTNGDQLHGIGADAYVVFISYGLEVDKSMVVDIKERSTKQGFQWEVVSRGAGE